MDLVIVILFLCLYYLRPQEWSGMFSTIHFVQIVMLSGVAALFLREQSYRPRDMFRTPHDWAVFGFWAWLVLSAVHPWDTFKDNANLYIFYLVIVQILTSVPRMKIFVAWWTMLIVTVALLALASTWGFDPLDSLEMTNGVMKGRLVLNLSIFNNPNALGHSVVPAIPMLYYYLVWKRPVASRILGFALLAIPLYCIYLTVSKGAFLCAGITSIATMAFGRPKSVQVAIGVAAVLFGTTALFMLPRMNELNNSKSDAAIQGRVLAFKHGYGILQTKFRGIGKGEWGKDAFITDYVRRPAPARKSSEGTAPHFVMKPVRHGKAPHSTYVCIGAELGKPGLYLMMAVLFYCLKTTMTAKTQTPDEERIRRMLFVLVVSYIVSSWMVDFEYRPTFFMFAAAIAALHRHLMGMLTEKEEESGEEPVLETYVPVWQSPQLLPQPAMASALPDSRLARQVFSPEPEPGGASVSTSPKMLGIDWNRIGWIDGVMIFFLTWGVIRFWAYIMDRM
ncbi:MAG: hypothetical protein ABJF10_00530 [Chthoniobacter sp.]|uniref:O-antigen ligase family protein n=1 Tax=Chthoniobacter sp. TaxID=2510640 RepID=UPI0032A95162